MSVALGRLRDVVVRTASLPLLGASYRAIHRAAVSGFESRLSAIAGVRRLALPSGDAIVPGVSDLDLFFVLDGDPDGDEAMQRARAIAREVERARRGLPLAVDRRIFTRRELELGLALGDGFLARRRDALESQGFVRSGIPTSSRAEALGPLQLRTYHTLRAARHAVEGDDAVASALAAHSLSRAGFGDAPRGTDEEVVAALAALDVLLDVADDDQEDPVEQRLAAHLGIVRLRAQFDAWSASLRRVAAVDSVALVADSAATLDVRLVVVVDPTHPSAAGALRTLRTHFARRGTPRVRADAPPMRPQVVTRTLLERPASHRAASLEPVLRATAHVVGTPLPAARIPRSALARNLALGLLFTSSELREAASASPSRDALLRAHAAVHGALPAAGQILAGEPVSPSRDDSSLRTGLLAEASRALYSASNDLLPRLVRLA